MTYSIQKSIFNFCLMNIDNKKNIPFSKRIPFGKYVLCTSNMTPVEVYEKNDQKILILGYAVNVKTGRYDNIGKEMLSISENINDILKYEKYMGGKYLLIYQKQKNTYIIPDATSSIPCNYLLNPNEVFCSSLVDLISKEYELIPDVMLKKIRDCSDKSQAMPFNYTIYKEIKQLIPNHYLCLEKGIEKRIINSDVKQETISSKKAAEITNSYIEKLTQFYCKLFKIYCPITGGKDSRVVLAYIRKELLNKKNFTCYTIKHKEFAENNTDILIPKNITKFLSIPYMLINDEDLEDGIVSEIDQILGKNTYSKRTLMIANTIYTHFKDGAVINGDIIGQVGKCSLHRDIPEKLASATYFRCKIHNYSKESKILIKEWMDDIKEANEKINLFDLFSIESRMGRWAAQENEMYNTVGQLYLNIFNSRSIIYEWTKVNRSERKESSIHNELLKIADSDVYNFHYENSESLLYKISTLNGICYYLSSRVKYVITKILFYIKH